MKIQKYILRQCGHLDGTSEKQVACSSPKIQTGWNKGIGTLKRFVSESELENNPKFRGGRNNLRYGNMKRQGLKLRGSIKLMYFYVKIMTT